VVCELVRTSASSMKDWIPLIGAFLRFLAGIGGTWSTQRGLRKTEAEKWQQEA
jgi:hypothetical protein